MTTVSMRASAPPLLRAVSGLSLLAILAAGVAFVREMVQASTFGAGAAVDAYLIACAVPVMINTSVVSTLEAAFVPLYVARKAAGSADGVGRLADAVLAWTVIACLALAAGFVGSLRVLVPWQAPGFSAAELRLVARLAWWTAPSIVFAALYAVGRSILNAERRFAFPALAQAVNAAVMIAVMLAGHRALGIDALAIGYSAGTVGLWLTVFIPLLLARLPGRRLRFGGSGSDLAQLSRTLLSLLGGVLAMAAIPVVDRLMASRFPAGAISALGYADRVIQVPLTLIVSAVTTAAFPMLAHRAVRGDLPGLKRVVGASVVLITVVLAPVAALLLVRPGDVVSVLFERGAFTASSVASTSTALMGLAAGLIFMGALQIVPRVFNALQLSIYIAFSGLLALVFKIAFNLVLIRAMGFAGFAVATSAMYLATGLVMAALLRMRITGLGTRLLIRPLAAAIAAAGVMALVTALVGAGLHTWVAWQRLAVSASVGLASYALVVWLLGGRSAGVLSWLHLGPEDH